MNNNNNSNNGYGAIVEEKKKKEAPDGTNIQQHQRRRSTLLVFVDEVKSYGSSILSLCLCTFCMSYLLISPFPYSGFMAMQLVDGVTEETAGPYAGIISSSFFVGRALSSIFWGRVADTYGRRFVLIVNLLLSCIFSLLFGLSINYTWAITTRFLLGLSNGIMTVTKTVVSDLARGDNEKETSAMGLVIAIWGWGMFIGPAISGVLSEPTKHYPSWFANTDGVSYIILSKFPFLLPNVVAAVLCFVSMITVSQCIEETLPMNKRRSLKYVPRDICDWFAETLSSTLCCFCRHYNNKTSEYESVGDDSGTTSTSPPTPIEVDDTNDDLKILIDKECSEVASLLTSKSARSSFTAALHRPSKIMTHRQSVLSRLESSDHSEEEHGHSSDLLVEKQQHRQSRQEKTNKRQQESTSSSIGYLFSHKSLRECLLAYWLYCFVSVAVDETFPLFCMSKEGGLGIYETTIGGILTVTGLIFVIMQYFIFKMIVDRYGLYKGMTIGALFGTVPVVFIPISLLFDNKSSTTAAVDDEDSNGITWLAFAFLSTLLALIRVFGIVFSGAEAIAINRTVETSDRATVNGLSSLGASISRGLGPAFAGALYSFCVSSGIFNNAHLGSVVAFTVLGSMGIITTIVANNLSGDDEDDDAEDGDESNGDDNYENVSLTMNKQKNSSR